MGSTRRVYVVRLDGRRPHRSIRWRSAAKSWIRSITYKRGSTRVSDHDQSYSLAREHRCEWRGRVGQLEKLLGEALTGIRDLKIALAEKDQQLATLTSRVHELEHKLALTEKKIVGPKSERMPTPEDEAKKRAGSASRGGNVNPKKRKENAEAMASLPTTTVEHPVPDGDRHCPHCGEEITPIGEGDISYEWEWIPGRFERRKHVVEVGRCRCKQHYARGPAPVRVQEGCTYGPAFIAKLVVDKCADATPIYRVEKAMRRAGIPISRSTMNDLVLLAADVCMPLWLAQARAGLRR